MTIEGVAGESERIDDMDKAKEMADATDWQRSEAARARAEGRVEGGAYSAEWWDRGGDVAENLAAHDFEVRKEAEKMSPEELSAAIGQTRDAREAEMAKRTTKDIQADSKERFLDSRERILIAERDSRKNK